MLREVKLAIIMYKQVQRRGVRVHSREADYEIGMLDEELI